MPIPLKRQPASHSTAILQSMAVGKTFDGKLPSADSVYGPGGVFKFPEDASHGGLFYWDTNEPVVCGQFFCDLGGSANFQLFLVNLDPASVRAAQAGTGSPVVVDQILIDEHTGVTHVTLDESHFKTVLLPFQALQLITTASAGKQVAQAIASIERTYVR